MTKLNTLLLAGVAAATIGLTVSASANDDMNNITNIDEQQPYSYAADYPAEERTAGNKEANYDVKGTVDANNNGYVGDVDVDLQAKANSNVNTKLAPSEITMVQKALNDNGFRISVDGIIGKETRQAVKSFQTSKDMSVTGNLDPQTLAALDVISMDQTTKYRNNNKM